MNNPSRLLVAASLAALTFLSAGAALAQGTAQGMANTGTATTAAPAATTATAATPPETTTAETSKAAPKKKKKKPVRETRQQEIDRSIDQGTVPARYRSQVPREYQQYIPFDRR